MIYEVLLFLHVLGATVLLGTGAGIAFFMVMSHQSKDARLIAHVSGIVVIADTVFTATAAIAQPVTGYLLAREVGWQNHFRQLISGSIAGGLPLDFRHLQRFSPLSG